MKTFQKTKAICHTLDSSQQGTRQNANSVSDSKRIK